jgi:hypothetical protein
MKPVVAGATVETIVPASAFQEVVALSSVEPVVIASAFQDVIPTPAAKHIFAVVEPLIGPPDQDVVAPSPDETVIASATVEEVVCVGTDQDVIGIRTDNVLDPRDLDRLAIGGHGVVVQIDHEPRLVGHESIPPATRVDGASSPTDDEGLVRVASHEDA